MSERSNCPRHQDNWMERHVAEHFLLVVASMSIVSALLFGNFVFGFLLGTFIASWLTIRCMAKDVYFTTVHRIRREVNHE